MSGVIGPVAAAVLEIGFFLVLPGFVLREVAAARNWANLFVVAGLCGVAAANLAV